MFDSSRAGAVARTRGDPASCYDRWRQSLETSSGLLLVDFSLPAYWQGDEDSLDLTAIYHLDGLSLEVAVTDCTLEVDGLAPRAQFSRWVARHGLYAAAPDRPLPLCPLCISKPWGREIWYTGVEARGVCCFGDRRRGTPIPWLQAALPRSAAGRSGEPLILLKILDPLAGESKGGLYFELHEEKREVYVVTRVNREAWPDGIGYIRIGFNQERVAAAGNDQVFREAYLDAVNKYEVVRRELDALPVDAARQPEMLRCESELRRAMNDFTHMRPVTEGDVIAVPPLTPHSLQHGVRAVEFQTPLYERKILSFDRKVLTQNHWDTAAAVRRMHLYPPDQESAESLASGEGVMVERIAGFPDFEVRRVVLEGVAGLSW